MQESTPSFAPGKVLLLGEHSVVYGHPAVVIPISLGVSASITDGAPMIIAPALGVSFAPDEERPEARSLDKALRALFTLTGPLRGQLYISGDLPFSRGLGSSAAVATAVAKAIWGASGYKFTQEELERAVMESERILHKNPSGADAAASIRERCLLFHRGSLKQGSGAESAFEQNAAHRKPSRTSTLPRVRSGRYSPLPRLSRGIKLPAWLTPCSDAQKPKPPHCPQIKELTLQAPFSLIIVDTGERISTATLVAGIATLKEREPSRVEGIMQELGALSLQGAVDLQAGRLVEVGAAMDRAFVLLSSLSLSTPMLERAAREAKNAGALGAKLTGAGGGGCLVALSSPEKSRSIRQHLRSVGLLVLETDVLPAALFA